MISLALTCGLALSGCPHFSEIFSDPRLVEDSKGEFVEVRFAADSPDGDTLFVFFEEKLIYQWVRVSAMDRVLLHRDTSACPLISHLQCDLLTGVALPNSRESVWKLVAGTCVDSTVLPVAQAGLSYQRSESGEWVTTEPTPGVANPLYEEGIRDCAVSFTRMEYSQNRWRGILSLTGCDSVEVTLSERSLDDAYQKESYGVTLRDSLPFVSKISAQNLWLESAVPEDDYPNNDVRDTLLIIPRSSPLFLTEIHACPEEPIPEWVEIYNGSALTLPLTPIQFCHRGTIAVNVFDSLQPRETLVLTRDTTAFREWLGFNDARVLKANLGFLKNSADTLLLCWGETRLDSVVWGKEAGFVPECPTGFIPRSHRKENSPGFQSPGSLNRALEETSPFEVKLSARVCSKKMKQAPLMVSVASSVAVKVELLSGNGILLWTKTLVADPSGNLWVEVPLISKGTLGPNFIRFSEGRHEKMVGVILRP